MKKTDKQKLHALDPSQLNHQLTELRTQLVTIRHLVKLNKEKNTSKIKGLKYQIALLNTIKKHQELASQE